MLFAWSTSEDTHLIVADDEDAAYEITIKQRIDAGETREEAEAHAEKNDRLEEIASCIGDIPIQIHIYHEDDEGWDWEGRTLDLMSGQTVTPDED